jgi:hypothetical protein
VAGKGGTPCEWPPMRPGADDLVSAAVLQVQAAWLRPNLLRLQHAWLHNVQQKQTDVPISMRDIVQGWGLAQRAPSLHPAVVHLGVGRPAVAAAVQQLGRQPLEEELQVKRSNNAPCVVWQADSRQQCTSHGVFTACAAGMVRMLVDGGSMQQHHTAAACFAAKVLHLGASVPCRLWPGATWPLAAQPCGSRCCPGCCGCLG